MRVDYRQLQQSRVVFPAVAVTMLLLIGVFAMQRHEWRASLDSVWRAVTLQPSELAKPVLVLFLAYFLQTRIHAMDDWKGTILRAALPPLVFIGADLEGAGSGDGAGVRGGDGADAVSGGGADEVLCDWRGAGVRR